MFWSTMSDNMGFESLQVQKSEPFFVLLSCFFRDLLSFIPLF